ncbi:MAG: hypothetical protein Q8Q37_02810 [bacterium]|nr:hypothetical protein [bacterium]
MNKKIRNIIRDLKIKPAVYWIKRGEQMALRLFGEMVKEVPAYKRFLKSNGIKMGDIKNMADFKLLPTLDKGEYLKKYPLVDLCWGGELSEKHWVYSVTSGSTGEPFYFPRQDDQDMQYATTAEIYLNSNFKIDRHKTLYINGFAMGAWIGGLFTYQALKHLVSRGDYALSIINPGLNKSEILKAFRKLAPYYNQIIIGGYPPFVKDLLDEGLAEGIKWRNYNMKFIFSAEGFSEKFRDYIAHQAGLKNIYRDTLNHYGTVDLGTMSYETPLSILIRRLAIKNKKLYKTIFGDIYKLPTLTQYFPEMFFFEEINGGLVCSAYSGLPLARYDLKDNGGVIGFDEMLQHCRNAGINLENEIKKAGIKDTIQRLPFVFVYERSDFVVTLNGFNIYPETIRRALGASSLSKNITGKFTMVVDRDKGQNQVFKINIELRRKIKKSKQLSDKIRSIIINHLLKENSEYRESYNQTKIRMLPRLTLWPYEHPLYFHSGGKQKWVKK